MAGPAPPRDPDRVPIDRAALAETLGAHLRLQRVRAWRIRAQGRLLSVLVALCLDAASGLPAIAHWLIRLAAAYAVVELVVYSLLEWRWVRRSAAARLDGPIAIIDVFAIRTCRD